MDAGQEIKVNPTINSKPSFRINCQIQKLLLIFATYFNSINEYDAKCYRGANSVQSPHWSHQYFAVESVFSFEMIATKISNWLWFLVG